jgi:hemerythrin superfamily protein
MDALTLLTADHNRVRGLFERFEKAKDANNTATLASLGTTIFEELEVHTTIEEEQFYPSVHDLSDEIGEIVDEGIEEHHVVKVLMEEIRALDPASDEWQAKMTVLIENVKHHADEEESDMFPKVRSAANANTLESLGDQFEAKKAELGAPTLADKIDLTKTALLEKAKDQSIPGRSKMSQEELAATVAP